MFLNRRVCCAKARIQTRWSLFKSQKTAAKSGIEGTPFWKLFNVMLFLKGVFCKGQDQDQVEPEIVKVNCLMVWFVKANTASTETRDGLHKINISQQDISWACNSQQISSRHF